MQKDRRGHWGCLCAGRGGGGAAAPYTRGKGGSDRETKGPVPARLSNRPAEADLPPRPVYRQLHLIRASRARPQTSGGAVTSSRAAVGQADFRRKCARTAEGGVGLPLVFCTLGVVSRFPPWLLQNVVKSDGREVQLYRAVARNLTKRLSQAWCGRGRRCCEADEPPTGLGRAQSWLGSQPSSDPGRPRAGTPRGSYPVS